MRTLILTAAVLIGNGTALAEPADPAKPTPAKGSPEEVVCRREQITGSLAGYKKTCATRAEWIRQSDAAQTNVERMEEGGRVAPGNPPG